MQSLVKILIFIWVLELTLVKGQGASGGGGGYGGRSTSHQGTKSIYWDLLFFMGFFASVSGFLFFLSHTKSPKYVMNLHFKNMLKDSKKQDPVSEELLTWLTQESHENDRKPQCGRKFDGIYSGTCPINKGSHPQTIHLDWKTMSNENLFSVSGDGQDEIGDSLIEGKLSIKNGVIAWIKHYDTHSVIYWGQISQQVNQIIISGHWEITDLSHQHDNGTFQFSCLM